MFLILIYIKMPKLSVGILIKCEKTIKLFIKNLDKDNTIILKDLDDHHLLIEERKLAYVQQMVYQMQDDNSYKEIQVIG